MCAATKTTCDRGKPYRHCRNKERAWCKFKIDDQTQEHYIISDKLKERLANSNPGEICTQCQVWYKTMIGIRDCVGCPCINCIERKRGIWCSFEDKAQKYKVPESDFVAIKREEGRKPRQDIKKERNELKSQQTLALKAV